MKAETSKCEPKIIHLLYLFNGKTILCLILLLHTTDENILIAQIAV